MIEGVTIYNSTKKYDGQLFIASILSILTLLLSIPNITFIPTIWLQIGCNTLFILVYILGWLRIGHITKFTFLIVITYVIIILDIITILSLLSSYWIFGPFISLLNKTIPIIMGMMSIAWILFGLSVLGLKRYIGNFLAIISGVLYILVGLYVGLNLILFLLSIQPTLEAGRGISNIVLEIIIFFKASRKFSNL